MFAFIFSVRYSLVFCSVFLELFALVPKQKNEQEKNEFWRKKLRVEFYFEIWPSEPKTRLPSNRKKAPTTMQQIICVALTFAHMNTFMRLHVSFRPAAHPDFHFIRTIFSFSVALFGLDRFCSMKMMQYFVQHRKKIWFRNSSKER